MKYGKRKRKDGSTNDVVYKGVQKTPAKRFRAQIKINGKNTAIGTFDTSKEAAVAYDLASLKAGRPRSSFNFPERVPKI